MNKTIVSPTHCGIELHNPCEWPHDWHNTHTLEVEIILFMEDPHRLCECAITRNVNDANHLTFPFIVRVPQGVQLKKKLYTKHFHMIGQIAFCEVRLFPNSNPIHMHNSFDFLGWRFIFLKYFWEMGFL